MTLTYIKTVFMNIYEVSEPIQMSLTILIFYRHNLFENPDIQYVASLDLSHLSDDSAKFFPPDKRIYTCLLSGECTC